MRASIFFLATLAAGSIAHPHVGKKRSRLDILLEKRQSKDTPDNTCGMQAAGANNGYTCTGPEAGPAGFTCCSSAGWCGSTTDYCGTGCQPEYGTCGGGTTPPDEPEEPGSESPPPSGPIDTSVVPRPHIGDITYGDDIYDCINPAQIAMTFDDGPWIYTNDLLDLLAEQNVKATFFVTGNNLEKGDISDPVYGWDVIVKHMYDAGHQIASHTWTHPNLTALTDQGIKEEMWYNEKAIAKIIGGKFPTYMRPPFSACGDNCKAVMDELGYHIIYFDLDTDDYNQDSAAQIQTSKDIVTAAIANTDPQTTDFLSISHDIHWQTVYNLTKFQIETAKAWGYEFVTVGECLGDAPENWYRSVETTPPPASSSSTSSTTSTESSTSTTETSTSETSTTETSTSETSTTETSTSTEPPTETSTSTVYVSATPTESSTPAESSTTTIESSSTYPIFTPPPSLNGTGPTTTNSPPPVSTTSYGTITLPPTYASPSPTAEATVTATVTTYIDICPTGLTTITATYTTNFCPATTYTTVCTVCGPAPTTVTITKPVYAKPIPKPTGYHSKPPPNGYPGKPGCPGSEGCGGKGVDVGAKEYPAPTKTTALGGAKTTSTGAPVYTGGASAVGVKSGLGGLVVAVVAGVMAF